MRFQTQPDQTVYRNPEPLNRGDRASARDRLVPSTAARDSPGRLRTRHSGRTPEDDYWSHAA